MTTYNIEYAFLPSVAQNGKTFKEDAPNTYKIGDAITWTVSVTNEGRPVDTKSRRRRGQKQAVENRTFTLTVDGVGKEFMDDMGKERQRFYGEITVIIESL